MTQVVAVREWIVAQLLGDAALVALLGTGGPEFAGVYDEEAPEGAPFPYVVIGNTEEYSAREAFGAPGTDGVEAIRIHTRATNGTRPGSTRAKQIYSHVHRLLHGAEASLDGGAALWNARLRLVTTFPEQDGITNTAAAQFTFNTLL